MIDHRDQRRSRWVTALAAAAALLAAGAVAVPAAGAAAGGSDGAPSARAARSAADMAKKSRTKTKKTKTSTSSTTTRTTTRTSTTTPRPHCTGCVEHAVFGFEDGSTQRWLPYGKASAVVTYGVAATMTSPGPTSFSAMPHSGLRQLTVSGMGNAAGLRWPGTSDTILAGFQARVWVRTHGRTGTLRLSISNSYAHVSASAVVGPDEWTPITTPSFFGNHQTATISLTQDEYCRDGDLGGFDLDDTAIASSFSPEPAVWRSDDSSLLAASLPQITLSMLPCPTVTPTVTSTATPSVTPTSEETVLDFEEGTTQGWEAIGEASVKASAQSALDGSLGLRVVTFGRTGSVARLVTPVSSWRGSGAWYRLTMLAAAKRVGQTSGTTIFRTCAPPIVVTPSPLPATLQISAAGATQVVGGRFTVGEQGTPVTVWFQLPEGKKSVSIALSVVSPGPGPLALDDVVLSRVSDTASASPSTTQPHATTSAAPARVAPLC